MKSIVPNEKTKKLFLFSLSLVTVMALVFLLGSSLKEGGGKPGNEPAAMPASVTGTDKLIRISENLQQQLLVLQQLDGQYAAVIADTAFAAKADSLNKLIVREEAAFGQAVEAAGEEGNVIADDKVKEAVKKMITAYRLLAESRQSAGIIRNIAAVNGGSLAPDEKQLLHLQNELMEKSSRIASLEATMMRQQNMKPVMENSNTAALLENIAALESKLTALHTSNAGLKQENERLQQLQADMLKNAGSAEKILKEKNISLQQRIDDLDAEIQLVKVDCNLNRVDATQIISNAKQRRQLLNEASDILTNLSASSNAEISRKVKEKVSKLNRVAGNYRE